MEKVVLNQCAITFDGHVVLDCIKSIGDLRIYRCPFFDLVNLGKLYSLMVVLEIIRRNNDTIKIIMDKEDKHVY